jgi:hypothetical protein
VGNGGKIAELKFRFMTWPVDTSESDRMETDFSTERCSLPALEVNDSRCCDVCELGDTFIPDSVADSDGFASLGG